MGRFLAAHRCVMCDSIMLEALAVVVDGVSGIFIVSVFVSITTYYIEHSYYVKNSHCMQICYV